MSFSLNRDTVGDALNSYAVGWGRKGSDKIVSTRRNRKTSAGVPYDGMNVGRRSPKRIDSIKTLGASLVCMDRGTAARILEIGLVEVARGERRRRFRCRDLGCPS